MNGPDCIAFCGTDPHAMPRSLALRPAPLRIPHGQERVAAPAGGSGVVWERVKAACHVPSAVLFSHP